MKIKSLVQLGTINNGDIVEAGFLAGAAKQKELCDEREKLLIGVIDEVKNFKFNFTHFPTITINDEAANMANRCLNDLVTIIEQKLKDLK